MESKGMVFCPKFSGITCHTSPLWKVKKLWGSFLNTRNPDANRSLLSHSGVCGCDQ